MQRQALAVASPRLYARAERWLAGETLSEEAKLVVTLHKYLIRMTTRSTPYGLFAGCALGTIGGTQTAFLAEPPTAATPYARLDIDCLQAIKDLLLAQPDIRDQLLLSVNTTVHRVGDYFRFIEQQQESTGRTYYISAVGSDDLLPGLFAFANTGVTRQRLIDFLHVQHQVAMEDGAAYVEELIASQLLVFDLEPTLTGAPYLTVMQQRLGILADSDAVTQARQMLVEVSNLVGQRPTPLTALHQYLAEHGVALPETDFIQVDAVLPADLCQLSEQWLNHVQHQIRALLVLNQTYQNTHLDEFKQRFYLRYEDEEVPLAFALDHEMGVGYGNMSSLGVGSAPMLDNLTLSSGSKEQRVQLTDWQVFVLNRYTEALRYGQPEIVITDDDLRRVGNPEELPRVLPTSFYAFGTLLAPDAAAVDSNEYLFSLTACQGPSAINLLSRFGEASPALSEQISRFAQLEEVSHPDVIIAEVVHFPESRAGNISHRPTLYQYEIPYLGRASVAPEYQISLTDLYLSVRNDRLMLRSKRLNKRVIPRLSNAHNFRSGLPIYQFLGSLQYQDAYLNVHWDWGLLAQQAYLPRVRYKNILLNRASWQLRADDLLLKDATELRQALVKLGIPAQFVIVQGDNELRIDTGTDVSFQLFGQELRRAGSLKIVEWLTGTANSPVRDQDGHTYAHEIVLPFHNPSAPAYTAIDPPAVDLPQRRFSVGSEWLYLKIYAGEKASDALLVEQLYPVIQELLSQQTVQQFFFIRYLDQDPHLRLRFRGNPHIEFYHYVIRRVEQVLHPYVQSGVVHKIQTDTYQRELERYGMNKMPVCERFFHHDSLSTLQFMKQTGEAFDENLRFAFAAHKVDNLLTGLSFNMEERCILLSTLKEGFFAEFGGGAVLRQELNDHYRTYKPLLEQALSRPFTLREGFENWLDEQQPPLTELTHDTPRGTAFFSLVRSLIHMTVNRLFPSKQRVYELMLYHCLAKLYDSRRARQRQQASE